MDDSSIGDQSILPSLNTSTKERDFDSALSEISKLQGKLVELEKEHIATKEENIGLYHKIAEYKEHVAKLQNELSAASSIHIQETSLITNAADNDINGLKEENKQLDILNNKLKSRIKELEDNLVEYQENKEKLSKQEDMISQQQSIAKNYELTVQRLESECERIKKDYYEEIDRKSNFEDQTADVLKLKKTIEQKDKELTEIRKKHNDKSKELKSLKLTLKKKEEEIKELTLQNEEAIIAVKRMSIDFIDLKNREKELLDALCENNIKLEN